MSSLWGADLNQMDQLQKTLRQSATKAQAINRAAGAAVSQIQWSGPDAHRYGEEWRQVHSAALLSAARALEEAADTISRNRQAQNDTSATGSGSTTPPIGSLPGGGTQPTAVLFKGPPVDIETSASPDEIASKIDDLLSYGAFDWNVSKGEQEEALALLLSSDDLPAVIAELDERGDLDLLIGRIDSPELRLQLLRALGDGMDADGKELVLPHVQNLGTEFEIQYHLGELGLPISNTEFDRDPYDDLTSDDPSAPFTGVGATGVNAADSRPGDIGVLPDIALTGEDGYRNPIGPLFQYLDGLPDGDRERQVELLVNQPISSEPGVWAPGLAGPGTYVEGIEDSYAGNIPSRRQVIELAAERYDLEPELLTAIILAEQRDQSANEDAAEYQGATMVGGNTSIGLGQIVVSTAENNDLFSDLLSEETRSDLNHNQVATLLASDEVNIFATAQYIRQVADQAANYPGGELPPNFAQDFPGIDPAAYGGHSSTWPPININALGSEYTSDPWDVADENNDGTFENWGQFVDEAYQDVQGSEVFE